MNDYRKTARNDSHARKVIAVADAITETTNDLWQDDINEIAYEDPHDAISNYALTDNEEENEGWDEEEQPEEWDEEWNEEEDWYEEEWPEGSYPDEWDDEDWPEEEYTDDTTYAAPTVNAANGSPL